MRYNTSELMLLKFLKWLEYDYQATKNINTIIKYMHFRHWCYDLMLDNTPIANSGVNKKNAVSVWFELSALINLKSLSNMRHTNYIPVVKKIKNYEVIEMQEVKRDNA